MGLKKNQYYASYNIVFMKEEIKAHNNVLELIGNTPLIKLNNITKGLSGNFYAKVEAFNPGHSTKDRIALYIIEEAEKRGILKPGDTIIETTSGNTGFSLAMVSIIKGYECILAVSSKSSKDKIDIKKEQWLDFLHTRSRSNVYVIQIKVISTIAGKLKTHTETIIKPIRIR